MRRRRGRRWRSRGESVPWEQVRAEAGLQPLVYRIEWRPRARKAFLALDNPVRRRIGAAADALAADPRPDGPKILTGAHGVLRIRVGDYRVLHTIEEGELMVPVVEAGHRGQIYEVTMAGAGIVGSMAAQL
jgi:mRNA interferase RelE/StbE